MVEFKFFVVFENFSLIMNDLIVDELVVLVIGIYYWCIVLINWLDWFVIVVNDVGIYRSYCGGC